jgi:hypothetical protein
MKRRMLRLLATGLSRFRNERGIGRMIAPGVLAGDDRQTALDYELSFWRAAAPIWY